MHGQEDRARVLLGLGCVDAVVVFDEDSPHAALERLRPDVWAKGGDYAAATLPEAPLVRSWGGRVVLLPYLPGRSTTRILEKRRALMTVTALRDIEGTPLDGPVLVTGGSSGLGAAVVAAVAKRGGRAVVLDRQAAADPRRGQRVRAGRPRRPGRRAGRRRAGRRAGGAAVRVVTAAGTDACGKLDDVAVRRVAAGRPGQPVRHRRRRPRRAART